MHIQLRKTTLNGQYYNDHFFDTEEETLNFWKMLANTSSQVKWLELNEKRVTILVSVL